MIEMRKRRQRVAEVDVTDLGGAVPCTVDVEGWVVAVSGPD